MALVVTINSVDRTNLVRAFSVKITDEMHTRNIASFQMVSESSSQSFYRPTIGWPIVISYNGTDVFAGTVDRIKEERKTGMSTVLFIEVECVSWDQILDRHQVAKAYDNQTLGAIVTDILTDDLAGEGLTSADIQTGPTIEKAVFNYASVTEVFNELAQVSGWEWWIDTAKGLHFVPNGTSLAPVSITSEEDYLDLTVSKERGDYRNVQYIKAGQDITDNRTEEFRGDGNSRTFTLAFPLAELVSVKKNGVAQTTGIRAVEQEGTSQFYYQVNDAKITQDLGETVFSSSDILEVVYKGFFPLLVIASLPDEIDARIAVEGGTGRYEAVEDRQEINVAAFAFDIANGILRRKGIIPDSIDISLLTPGFRAGQLLTIALPAHDLNGDYLVTRVEFEPLGTIDDAFAYRIEAMSGEALGGWAEFWMGLAKRGKRFTVRENEVAGPLIYNPEPLDLTETFSTAQDASPVGVIDVDEIGWCEVG